MKKIFFLFLPIVMFSQEVPIGNWKNYQSYASASHICETDERIYCISSNGIYYVTKEDNSITRLSKINGLSDVTIKKSEYDKITKTVIIVYENCNIDLIKENSIINVSDIKRKEITGEKTINNIYTKNGIAYLSSSFGIVLLDLINQEIIDTYQIGFENGFVGVKGCVVKSDTIFAASINKIYYANINSAELFDYTNWSELTGHTNYNTIHNIVASENVLLIDTGFSTNISYNNNAFLLTNDDEVIIYSNDTSSKTILTSINFKNPKYAYKDTDENIWIADSLNGLLKFENMQYSGSYTPQGPISNKIYSLGFYENNLYVCHGGHSNFGQNLLINEGASIKNYSDDWTNNDRWFLGNARDVLEVAVKNNQEYYASWYHGVSFVEDNMFIKKYGFNNTNGVLDTTYYSNNRIRVSDLKFDKNGNLWGLSSEVNNPLFVKTPDEEWYAFSMNQGVVDLFFDDLIIDYWNQKWGVIGREGGVFVYNDNNTIDNPSDDQFNILTINSGDGNLPSQTTYCIAEDLNHDIWIGTDKGVGVFYNPELVFTGYDFDAQQILIQEGDYGQYLLSEEKVKCIAIDGANRKWMGTEKSGIFLLSEDGTNEILHFTNENSPLPSNNIIDISVNKENGEVFIGTLKGLVSYRSNSTAATMSPSKTHVFPNPVREDYFGDIAINGLSFNANVKITNSEGQLVYEGVSYGGQAIWNGKNKNNQRVSTGIYLVFSVDAMGTEKIISKILFIK